MPATNHHLDSGLGSGTRFSRRFQLWSMVALVAMLVGRMMGPSDLWHQAQPLTVSYTTDMLVHGGSHWILPVERGELLATKPPLYNWLAAPMVRWLGYHSEIAHKFPSIVAVCCCWLLVVRLGNAIDQQDGSLGWLAGLMLVSNYAMFKLGYLARPDMLLTLWLALGWLAATKVILNNEFSRSRRWWLVLFWLCVLLASLTKGPAAIVLPVYALFISRWLAGTWSSARRFRLLPGLIASGLVFGAWVYGVWRINPDHVTTTLLKQEVVGRLTGTGPEGSQSGPMGFLIDMPTQPLYFLLRFLPWSIPAVFAIVSIIRARKSFFEPWPIACTTQILVIICVFTLSASKRADYIAGAFVPGAILAAWWLRKSVGRNEWNRPWLTAAAAAVTLATMAVVEQVEPAAPQRGFGNAIRDFIQSASQRIASEPMPGRVIFCWTGETQMQAMLGSSQIDGRDAVFAAIEKGDPFWLVAGRKTSEPSEFAQWLRSRRPQVEAIAVHESVRLPRDHGWPEQMTLYRVVPPRRIAGE